MSKFNFQYVSKIAPELTQAEVRVLMNNLLDMHHPDDIYALQVRTTANNLFPAVVTSGKLLWMDGRERIKSAIRNLEAAGAELDRVPQSSDDVAMCDLDIKQTIGYLKEEILKLEAESNVY